MEESRPTHRHNHNCVTAAALRSLCVSSQCWLTAAAVTTAVVAFRSRPARQRWYRVLH